MTPVSGFGHISSPNEVTVTKNDGSNEVIKTKKILIATGSEPIPFPGLDVNDCIITCVCVYSLSLSLMKRLLFHQQVLCL